MDTKKYIDGLFLDCEDTKELNEFKEEVNNNLNEKIDTLVDSGMPRQDAYNKATLELSDVIALANSDDDFKKKKDIVSHMYLTPYNHKNKKRNKLYLLCSSIFMFGVIASVINFFKTKDIASSITTVWMFCGGATLAYVFLLLTEDTKTKYPMKKGRAVAYVLTLSVFMFGIFVFFVTYTTSDVGLVEALKTLVPFVVPSGVVGAVLVLTQKDRRKKR